VDEFGPVLQTKLFHRAGFIGFDRFNVQLQQGSDIFIVVSLGDQPHDLTLTHAEGVFFPAPARRRPGHRLMEQGSSVRVIEIDAPPWPSRGWR
jgi:hypothetical protein